MSLDRLMLIVAVIFGGILALTWATGIVGVAAHINPLLGLVGLGAVAFVAYIAYRVVAERLGNADDDKYDRVEK